MDADKTQQKRDSTAEQIHTVYTQPWSTAYWHLESKVRRSVQNGESCSL